MRPLYCLQGVELELRKLEVAVQAIHQNLIYLKARQVISSTCLWKHLFLAICGLPMESSAPKIKCGHVGAKPLKGGCITEISVLLISASNPSYCRGFDLLLFR
jgi:hypothetical protein